MNFEIFLSSELIRNIGLTLVHSIWQIGLVAAMLYAALRIFEDAKAETRYLISMLALVLTLALPAITFVQLSRENRSATPIGGYGNSDGYADRQRIKPPAYEAIGGIAQKNDAETTAASLTGVQIFVEQNVASLLPYAVIVWLAGIAFFGIRLFGGFWQIQVYRTRETEPAGKQLQRVFEKLCETIGVGQHVKLLLSGKIDIPMAAGMLTPVVLMPIGLLAQMTPREIELIIAHELAHIRRFDTFITCFQGVVEVLFFYHPGMWWISAVVRREREFVADAVVMRAFDDSHIAYAKALADLEQLRLEANRQAPSIATAANGGNLMHRIQKILQKNTGMRSSYSAWTAGLAIFLIPVVLLSVFSINPGNLVNAQDKAKGRKLAVGFVSIPPVDRSNDPPKEADATARMLIGKLQQHKVPAIGFVNGGSISDGETLYPVRTNIVRMWRDGGFDIGIGNFKHVWFSNTAYDDYVAGVEKNERVVSKILAEKNQTLKYFSYPYLNTGKTTADRDRFEAWLKARGLSSVKYTIDNQEWVYSYAYDLARNDNDLNTMAEVRTAFIDYMSKMFDHYEAYSQEMFGRDVNQTMVLTPSRLVTDSFDDLFGMIKDRGYTFVSMAEAQSDAAYQTPEDFAGESGISWFERWAMKQGRKLRDEPKVTPEVWRTWKERKTK